MHSVLFDHNCYRQRLMWFGAVLRCWDHCCWIVQGVVGSWVDSMVEHCFDWCSMKVDVVDSRGCDVPVEHLVGDLSDLNCWVEEEVADGCDLRCVSEGCLMKCMGEGLR